ncbi:DUF2325 domain-containing protein [Malikia granosa]|uniref:DUF2325 domain-containing protein n=1 Tax=Malikia granosa TaxID=263067 RepID=A0A2S9K627_9BURK|nr:DUF2325 domain-containing protein [Malikia granosa]PRD65919.1 DUF2325 domain-containing protein [Malikia granosa]
MCEQCSSNVPASTGSRRRRLWDLPHQCHCPVVGVCFPLATLRQLVNKALGGKAVADDYEVHVGAVAECTVRNRLSELLQKDLETRYASTVKAFRVAKSAREVAELWAAAVRRGDVSGAFWAALTHPRCDDILQEVVLRDMHMLQHQAGAAIRVDISKFNELAREHGVLARELGRVQERCSRVIAEKSAEIDQLNAQLVRQRGLAIGKESRIACLLQDLEQLKAFLPDYEDASRLRKKLEQLMSRQAELEALNAQLREQLVEAQRALSLRQQEEVTAQLSERAEPVLQEVPITFHLSRKTILCVGGRNGNVANYRDVIERAGGHFAHHDGGLENKQGALDNLLAAADLVICQTGCISHNAYWRVKDFCKRTGKQCVFVENPSTSSLTRSLQQVADTEMAREITEI